MLQEPRVLEISGNPDKIRTKGQDTPLNQKFSEFYDGVSCLFVPVEQKKLEAKIYSKKGFLEAYGDPTLLPVKRVSLPVTKF